MAAGSCASTNIRSASPSCCSSCCRGSATPWAAIAADELWLSGAHGHDVVALHFTWRLDPPGVGALLPEIEAQLLPLGARPHWGKVFAATARELAPLYPMWTDFAELRRTTDPDGRFANAYTSRVLG